MYFFPFIIPGNVQEKKNTLIMLSLVNEIAGYFFT